jgi:hypothetical protein
VSSPDPIKAPTWWEPVDSVFNVARVKVHPGAEGRAVVVFGGIRLYCSLQQWRDVNDAVELGFSNLVRREVPARTDKLVGGDAA